MNLSRFLPSLLLLLVALALPAGAVAIGLGAEPPELAAAVESGIAERALRKGDRGEAVAALQRMLKGAGFDPGPVDGLFGPLTESAVRAAQRDLAVEVDGLFGRISLAALQIAAERAAAATAPPAVPAAPSAAPAPAVPVVTMETVRTPEPFGLTFNGNLEPALLDRLLTVLERHGQQATFFIPGVAAAEAPDQIARLIEAGHEVAPLGFRPHDMSHLSQHLLTSQIRLARQAIESTAGEAPRFFRPPQGRHTTALARTAEAEGMQMVLWTNVTVREGSERWTERLLETVYPGAVLMLHHDRAETVDAVDGILSSLRQRGLVGRSLGSLHFDGVRQVGRETQLARSDWLEDWRPVLAETGRKIIFANQRVQ